jgi:pimeloyl-ACP methyl ester carboxylesterase
VAFDGPGQGTVLDAGTPMTPDWHLPVAAILDYFRLADITLVGISLGGCLVIRAATGEPRVARAVAFDVCTDFFQVTSRGIAAAGLAAIAANSGQIPAPVVDAAVAAAAKLDLTTDWEVAQGKRVMGASTPAGVFRAWREYRTADVSPLVTQDVLLMAGTKDIGIPFPMLGDQLLTLTAARSVTARAFTEAEQAQNHCQVGNMGLALKVILGWLDASGGRTAV